MTWTLNLGSCLDPVSGLASLADDSVDAIVTDPPAGIGFMGKEWDSDKGGRDAWIAWLAEVMAAAYRVAKPGAQMLTWALPRTSHWTGTAIENAGWEVRDVHHHIFGTGFPKSLNVSSIMHELLGVTDGEYGTALKPAVEHWILARKPLAGTYTENIRAHGTGALNIGGCRIDGGARPNIEMDRGRITGTTYQGGLDGAFCGSKMNGTATTGRWPAHLSLDEYAARLLDEQSGIQRDGTVTVRNVVGRPHPNKSTNIMSGSVYAGNDHSYGSQGGASRFFFVAKAPRAEKDAGLEGRTRKSGGEATGRADGSAGTKNARAGAGRTGGVRNIHPTVKSVELMRWLVRLITPPGGLVLDMFAGSGTTGIACIAEGARFVGFELGADYHEIATARLEAASRQQALPIAVRPTEEAKPRPEQPSLFGGGL